MKRKIFIIHSSEIVRKGLNAILRSYFNAEIILLEKKEEMKTFCKSTGLEIVIISEELPSKEKGYCHNFEKNNRVKWISFLNDREESSEPLPFCNFHITLLTETAQLQNLVSRCFKKTRNPAQPRTNEELTAREKDVLKLVALGHSNKAIAEKLFISIHTVITHRKNITEKTGIKSISGLTVYAILNNLIDTENINPEDLI